MIKKNMTDLHGKTVETGLKPCLERLGEIGRAHV